MPAFLTLLALLMIYPVCSLFEATSGEIAQQGKAEAASRDAESKAATNRDQGMFEIHVVDHETGRGIPLIQLTTLHGVTFVTDNLGRIAIAEPQWNEQPIFFQMQTHGYRIPDAGFGQKGVRLKVVAGGRSTVRLQRENIAERLYRTTGVERYRESERLGYPVDGYESNGRVAGQDSVQAAIYRERIYWFWGDTNRLSFPLGLFRTAGATTSLPEASVSRADRPLKFKYFTRDDGFARAMIELSDPKGVVWLDGVTVVADQGDSLRMVGHYSRRPGLAKAYEHGICLFDDQRQIFLACRRLSLENQWAHLQSHPTRVPAAAGQDQETLQFGHPFLLTRVAPKYRSVLRPEEYQSWTCLPDGGDPDQAPPQRDPQGELDWRWANGPPTTQKQEQRWLREGLIREHELRFLPRDVENEHKRVMLHSGTVRWNAFRKRWVMISVEIAEQASSPSMLGEVWYAESTSPQGPFRKAIKVLTHQRQSFYNPCHHVFLDEQGGRFIYFEGTYCNTFTRSPPTPRYNYNQILYRLDLADPRLRPAWVEE